MSDSTTSTTKTPIKADRLGHLVYEVTDIERTTRFWTEILGFQVSDRNEVGIVFLRCENAEHHQVALVPSEHSHIAGPESGVRMNHLAMHVADVGELFKARAFLKEQGIPLVYEGRHGAGGSVGIEFLDPDGYVFELYCDLDFIGPDGRARPPEQWSRATTLEDAIAKPLPATW